MRDVPTGLGPVRFQCQLCGSCCRHEGLLVTLIGADIHRLSAALGLGFPEILRALDFHFLERGALTPEGLRDVPQINTERGFAYLALKKMANGDCVFLENDQCMIHPARPGVCRSFPFVFRYDDGEPLWGFSAKREICPGIGTGPVVSTSHLLELAETVLREQEMYSSLVDDWNSSESEPTAARFIEYILSDTGASG